MWHLLFTDRASRAVTVDVFLVSSGHGRGVLTCECFVWKI